MSSTAVGAGAWYASEWVPVELQAGMAASAAARPLLGMTTRVASTRSTCMHGLSFTADTSRIETCDSGKAQGLLWAAGRPKYESLLRELKVRPLKVQAARGVIVKLTEGDEVEVMASQDAAAASGV